MNLDTDAMRAAAEAYASGPVVAALQGSGPIRGDLLVGETGAITFADLYRVVPLGLDPTVPDPATDPNALPGFPLVRANVATAELRAAIEGTLQYSMINGDYFVAGSGLVVRYDMTRPPYDPDVASGVGPGWVTYMALDDGTLLYDVSNPDLEEFAYFAVDPMLLQPVVTTIYVASFAAALGITLRDDAGVPLDLPAGLFAAIIRRGDGSAVKDHESLAEYVYGVCDPDSGLLPSDYDAATPEGAVPRRMIDCTGGCP
jgi:hypothetical protein